MELLERAGAMAQVDTALREAAAGAGRIVLVAGEAGVGKTALVDAVARAAGPRARFLWGACDPLLTPRALGPIHDVARQTDGGLAEAIGGGAAREAVFAALLDELSGRPPTVLVVEDLHWADEATLDALAVVGRRIRHTPGTLLLTYRSDEIALHPEALALLGTLPADAVRRVEPAPLSVLAVTELARQAGRDPAGLHAATGGNAFFVTEVLASTAPGVPASVREVVRARLSRLSEPARALAETASVVPTRAEPWLLQEALGSEPAALDECVAAGLLTAAADGVAFRHDLARAAVAAGLPPSRRRALNARVLVALRTRGGVDPARLAHHARAAGDGEAILRHARDAAHAAAGLHAHAQALDHAEAALAAAAELGVDRTALLEQVSTAAYLCGRSDRAVAARRELLALHEAAGRSPETGDTLRWLARLEWFSGNGPAADRAARRAIEVLEPLGPSARLAMARSTLAQLHMLAWRNRDAIETGTRAADLAREVGDEEALAHALTNVGSALLWDGRGDEGRVLMEEAFARAMAADMPEHAVRALVNVAWADLALEAGDSGVAIERALAFAREHDLSGYVQYLLGIRAMYALRQGRWRAAEDDARASLEMGRHPGVSPCPSLVALGLVQGRRGEATAAATLDEAWERAQATGELQRLAPAATARLEVAWLAGDAGPALDEARAIHARCVGVADPWTLGELALGLWRAGEPAAEPGEMAEPYRRAMAGDWRGAAARWDELGRPYEAAEARAAGGDDAALLEALATFDRLGAAPAAARVRRRLRERGVARVPRGPRAATRALPAGLTPRQHEVLQLLVIGATNAEIAGRLVVSPKTVDHHVSAVLAKLGVASRREAAGAARRLGLDGPQHGEPAAPTWEGPPDAGALPRP